MSKILRFTSPVIMLLLSSCGGSESARMDSVIQNDMQQIYTADDVTEITFQQSIERAFANNLDAKIAEQDYLVALSDADLQKFNALPTITAKKEYISRSNSGASSSTSAITGVQSLEPSISTDQDRKTLLLEANWDVLDSAINIYKARSATDRAGIAHERLRKVRQNIYMDVRSAFYRSAMAARLSESINESLVFSDEKLNALDVAKQNGDMSFDEISAIQSEILDKRKSVQNMYRNLSLAEFELKALLSLPPDKPLKLVVVDGWLSSERLPKLDGNLDAYVAQAMKRRPELREEFLNLRISERNLNSTVLETFPGLSLLLGANHDDNSFLEDANWLSFTGTLSQSITRILTLPARYQKAQQDIELADARRQALIAAIVSQVYIAKILVDENYSDYNEQVRSFDLSSDKSARSKVFRENGLVGGFEDAIDRLDFEVAKVERFESFAMANQSYMRLMSAIGSDVGQFSDKAEPKKDVADPQVSGEDVHG